MLGMLGTCLSIFLVFFFWRASLSFSDLFNYWSVDQEDSTTLLCLWSSAEESQHRMLFIPGKFDIPESSTIMCRTKCFLNYCSFIFCLALYIHISFALTLWLWNRSNSHFHTLRKSLWVLSKSFLPSSLNNFLVSSCTLNTWWESHFLSPPYSLPPHSFAAEYELLHEKLCIWKAYNSVSLH